MTSGSGYLVYLVYEALELIAVQWT